MPLNMYVLGFTSNRLPLPSAVYGRTCAQEPTVLYCDLLGPSDLLTSSTRPRSDPCLPPLTSCPNSSWFLTSFPSYSFYNCPGARGWAEGECLESHLGHYIGDHDATLLKGGESVSSEGRPALSAF